MSKINNNYLTISKLLEFKKIFLNNKHTYRLNILFFLYINIIFNILIYKNNIYIIFKNNKQIFNYFNITYIYIWFYFFQNINNNIYISLYNENNTYIQIILDDIKTYLLIHKPIKQIFKNITSKYFLKNKYILGVKLIFKGCLKNTLRKTKQSYIYGNINNTTFTSLICKSISINTKYGIIGYKLFINYNILFKLKDF